MIAARQKAGPIAGMVLSLVFSFLLVLTATSDLFITRKLTSDQPLPSTIRLPGVGLYNDNSTGGARFHHVRMLYARGTQLKSIEQHLVEAYEDQRRPPSSVFLAGLGGAFFLILLLYTSHLRNLATTAFVRTQLVLLLGLLFLAVAVKAYLSLTPWSAMWIPLAALVIPCAAHLGAHAAGATSIAGGMIIGLLTPIDLPVLAVLCAQGLAAGVVAGKKGRRGIPVFAALAGGLGGGIGYAAVVLMLQQFLPSMESIWPPWSWLNSDLAGSVGGGVLGGVLSWVTLPVIGSMLGVVSKAKLLQLANFESPLLRQIASKTPGTWAHSLSMANMAEMAANAIGADALLVRVGAYYHDLGKTVQPEYFIENQQGHNPHDDLSPDVSADAIFSHITEGAKLARRHKLPEAVMEFIYTHHGDGLLEYFWYKNMQLGNPKGLEESDFHYPGCRPQRRETAILAICDAVEAASRTITEPNLDKIKGLVRQIVFTKVEQGGLNESGLSIEELEKIINSLVETLRSSLHVRVKYPWQREDETKRESPRKAAPADAPSEVIPLLAAKPSRKAGEDPSWPRASESKERSRVETMPLAPSARRLSEDPKSRPGSRQK